MRIIWPTLTPSWFRLFLRRRLGMRWIYEWGLRRWLLHKTYWALLHRFQPRCFIDWQHECVVCRKTAPGFHVHRDTLHFWVRPR